MWFVLVIVLLSSENPDWWPFYGSWILGLAVEINSLGLSISYHRPSNPLDIAQAGFKVGRTVLIVSLLALYFVKSRSRNWKSRYDEEAAPLLAHTRTDSHGIIIADNEIANDNLSIPIELDEEDKEMSEEEEEATMQKIRDKIQEKGSWFTYIREFLVGTVNFLPALVLTRW